MIAWLTSWMLFSSSNNYSTHEQLLDAKYNLQWKILQYHRQIPVLRQWWLFSMHSAQLGHYYYLLIMCKAYDVEMHTSVAVLPSVVQWLSLHPPAAMHTSSGHQRILDTNRLCHEEMNFAKISVWKAKSLVFSSNRINSNWSSTLWTLCRYFQIALSAIKHVAQLNWLSSYITFFICQGRDVKIDLWMTLHK